MNELVASFHECKHGSPRPSCRPRAVAECSAVRKIRGTPRQYGGWHAHDLCLFCACISEMHAPHLHAFSPHNSRGSADQKNSQPVIRLTMTIGRSTMGRARRRVVPRTGRVCTATRWQAFGPAGAIFGTAARVSAHASCTSASHATRSDTTMGPCTGVRPSQQPCDLFSRLRAIMCGGWPINIVVCR